MYVFIHTYIHTYMHTYSTYLYVHRTKKIYIFLAYENLSSAVVALFSVVCMYAAVALNNFETIYRSQYLEWGAYPKMVHRAICTCISMYVCMYVCMYV